MKNKPNLIFIIQGYDKINEMGQMSDVVTIELIDTDVAFALARAKKIIPKPNFRISSIIEKVPQDHDHA